MTKYVFQQSAFSADEAVSVAPYASFTFTDSATGAAADLWEDDAGLVPITGNVVLADEYGYVRAYLTAGFYDVAIVTGSLTKTLVDVYIGATAAITGYWDMTTPTPTCVATLSGDFSAPPLELQPFPTITGQTVSATGGAIYFASTNHLAPYPAFTDVRAFEIQVTQMDSGALGLTGVICSTDIYKSVVVAYFQTDHGGVWEFLVNNVTIDEYPGTGLERAGIKIDGATGNCWFYIDGIQRAAGSGVITDDVVLGIAWNGLSSAGSDVFAGEVVTAFADLAHDYGCLDWCGNAAAGGDAVLPTGAAAGYIYEVSVAGTYDGTDFSVGDLAVVRIDGVSVTRLGPGDRAYAESLVVGLWDDRGNYDASVNAYPSSGGSGTAGAILKGDIWTISVGGTLPTAQVVGVGDTVRALIDTPGNTQANWAIQENNIGYVPENSANKSAGTALGTSDTLYPTQKAVKTYVDSAAPPIITVIQRGQKFGNHSYLSYSVPVNGPYTGSSSGSTPLSSVALVEALTNRGNVADCTLWEMNSNTINTATDVSLYAFASSTIYPMSQWRTGAKLQFLASLALYNVIPTSENFCYRIGLANGANSDHRAADPWAGTSGGTGNEYTGCAAMFIADNTSPYWQCKSGRKTDTQTTVTAVPYVLGEFAVFHIVVTTTGVVEFRINGVLVATHSAAGVIPDGAYLSEGVAVRNIAATTTAKKGFWFDEFAFRHELPGDRTGFSFV